MVATWVAGAASRWALRIKSITRIRTSPAPARIGQGGVLVGVGSHGEDLDVLHARSEGADCCPGGVVEVLPPVCRRRVHSGRAAFPGRFDLAHLGRQHGQRGVDTLAHFAARHGKDDAAIRGDLDPAVERDVTLGLEHVAALPQPGTLRHDAPAHHQRASRASAGQQQGAPLHACTPAARLMAARTRW